MSPRLVLPVILALLAPAAFAGVPAPAASNPTADSQATIGKTKVPLYELIDQSEQGMQWSVQNVTDVGPALEAASKAIAALYAAHPSAVADAYGNGSMTNIEDTFKLFGGGNLERGCISHQSTTFDAVAPLLAKSSLTVKKIRIGTVLQHNAVIIFPAIKPGESEDRWKQTGLILDAWLKQKSALDRMVYTFKDWNSFGNRPRLLKDDE